MLHYSGWAISLEMDTEYRETHGYMFDTTSYVNYVEHYPSHRVTEMSTLLVDTEHIIKLQMEMERSI